MTAVGVLGGTFDPVHRGHIALATGVRDALGLARVVLVPCAKPPHKPERAVTAAYHRLEMLYLACEDWAGLTVETQEIARGGVSYTIDTLRELRAGGLGPVFVVGSDSLAEMGTWRGGDALLEEFDFAAVERPEDGGGPLAAGVPEAVRRHVTAREDRHAADRLGSGGRIVRVPMAALPVSSSLVRARAAASRPVDDLVPARIARYIQRHRLYR